jgi:hypothetical protein
MRVHPSLERAGQVCVSTPLSRERVGKRVCPPLPTPPKTHRVQQGHGRTRRGHGVGHVAVDTLEGEGRRYSRGRGPSILCSHTLYSPYATDCMAEGRTRRGHGVGHVAVDTLEGEGRRYSAPAHSTPYTPPTAWLRAAPDGVMASAMSGGGVLLELGESLPPAPSTDTAKAPCGV